MIETWEETLVLPYCEISVVCGSIVQNRSLQIGKFLIYRKAHYDICEFTYYHIDILLYSMKKKRIKNKIRLEIVSLLIVVHKY